MAEGKHHGAKSVYMMKQRGGGIGKYKTSKMYTMSQSGGGGSTPVVSPVEHYIDQAQSEVAYKKGGTKRKRSVSTNSSRKKHQTGKGRGSGTKKKRCATKVKKRKPVQKTKKRVSSKKKKRRKDRFD
jgi:hypothetical protein